MGEKAQGDKGERDDGEGSASRQYTEEDGIIRAPMRTTRGFGFAEMSECPWHGSPPSCGIRLPMLGC